MINGIKASTKDLRLTPYQEKVKTWEEHCSNCPFSIVELEKNGKRIKVKNIKEARAEILFDKTNQTVIRRGCLFNGEYFSLTEIISNTCMFWFSSKIESDYDDDEYCEVMNGIR